MTLREHLEAIAAGHVDGNPLGWIVDATQHAEAALAILDGRTAWWCDACRELSYDPEEHADCTGEQRRAVLIADQEPDA